MDLLTQSFLCRTTAQIYPAYVLWSDDRRHETRVDFCFVIEPHSSDHHRSIAKALKAEPHGSINHTDHTPVFDTPISISIETKRSDGTWGDAVYQMSTLFTAHWARLQSACPSATTTAEREDPGNTGIQQYRPICLPGIIIQGHDWMFVAATLGETRVEGGRETVFWDKVHIGSTNSLLGIIQIVSAIQRLAHWPALTYWPWFKEMVLHIPN